MANRVPWFMFVVPVVYLYVYIFGRIQRARDRRAFEVRRAELADAQKTADEANRRQLAASDVEADKFNQIKRAHQGRWSAYLSQSNMNVARENVECTCRGLNENCSICGGSGYISPTA